MLCKTEHSSRVGQTRGSACLCCPALRCPHLGSESLCLGELGKMYHRVKWAFGILLIKSLLGRRVFPPASLSYFGSSPSCE